MTDIDKKRLFLFLTLAFSIAWLCALVIALTGGLVNSPELIPNSGLTLALVLLASVYMWAPALANIFTRQITREGRSELLLKPRFKLAWPYWLAGWFGPGLLTLLGALLFFLVFPSLFDGSLSLLTAQLAAAGIQLEQFNSLTYIGSQVLLALLAAPLLNLTATFGEEFGWRAYLLPKLAFLGGRKSLLLSSLIWGVWHWPVVLMGHNYGLEYWGYPWTGLLATLLVFIPFGVTFGWLSRRAGSVWPAVFAHGALNGMAAIGLLFVREGFSPLLGPSPAGIIGCLPFTLTSLVILLKSTGNGEKTPIVI